MRNGCLKMQNYVPGAIKQWKDLQDVIIWRVYVAKVFAICVVNLGNLIIKIILNVIYIKRKNDSEINREKAILEKMNFYADQYLNANKNAI